MSFSKDQMKKVNDSGKFVKVDVSEWSKPGDFVFVKPLPYGVWKSWFDSTAKTKGAGKDFQAKFDTYREAKLIAMVTYGAVEEGNGKYVPGARVFDPDNRNDLDLIMAGSGKPISRINIAFGKLMGFDEEEAEEFGKNSEWTDLTSES